MDRFLARRSSVRFFAMRVLFRAACLTQQVSQWFAAQSQHQERIASALWADAIAAKRTAP
ncbi:MAG: hypothetical protein K2X46_06920 [Roseomonas sp.]|nr:hypothetical protein [Roseomonas sp.]